VPAFALRGLCGRIGPPILGGRHFQGNEILPNLQNFLVIIYNTENKNLQRSSVLLLSLTLYDSVQHLCNKFMCCFLHLR